MKIRDINGIHFTAAENYRMDHWPTAEQLRQWLAGRLSDADSLAIEAHVKHCPAVCQPLLDKLSGFENDPDKATILAPGIDDATDDRPSPNDKIQFAAGRVGKSIDGSRARQFGDYVLLEEIARGGMGVVYKARQVNLHRIVALKMILAGQLADESAVKRFYSEAAAAAALDHPGIVPIFEIGEHAGQHYFSMGLVEGESLAKKVASGPLPPRDAAELVKKVADAVEYAHSKGIIHRDLKPANVLLDRGGQPRVTDFGLAKQMRGDPGLTGTGDIMGTPSYMPPEQAAGRIDQIGAATDVYALGAILYCLLTGRPPFQAASPLETLRLVLEQEPVSVRQLNGQVPLELETITLKCLEKEASRRYGSARDLAAELQRFLNGEPIVARPIGALARSWRWCRRKPIVAGLIGTVAVSLMAGTIISYSFSVLAEKRAADLEKALGREKNETLRADAAARKFDDERKVAVREAEEAQKARTLAVEKQEFAEEQQEQAENARQIAREERDRANDQTEIALDRLYAADMQFVQKACEQGGLLDAFKRLARYIPRPGQKDRRRFEWFYWEAFCRPLPLMPSPNTGESEEQLNVCLRNPEFPFVVGGGTNGTLFQWRAEREDFVRSWPAHEKAIRRIQLSPQQDILLTVGDDNLMKLWDARSFELRATLPGHGSRIATVAFSPCGRRLASASWGKSAGWKPDEDRGEEVLKIWDVESGTQIAGFEQHEHPEALFQIQSLEFSADLKRLLVVVPAVSNTFSVIDLDARTVARRFEHAGASARFSPDGKSILAVAENVSIRIWNSETYQLDRVLVGANHLIYEISFDGSGEQVVARDQSGIKVWDFRTGRLMRRYAGWLIPDDGRRGWVASLPPSEPMQYPVRYGRAVWNRSFEQDRTTRRRHQLPGQFCIMTGIFPSPDGRQLLTVDAAGGMALSVEDSGPQLLTFWHLQPVSGSLMRHATAVDWKNRRYMHAGKDDDFVIASFDGDRPLVQCRGHKITVASLAISPDGARFASGDYGGVIRLWDADHGRELFQLTGHETFFSRTAGQEEASVEKTPGRTLVVHDEATRVVLDLAFHPQRPWLASAGSDGTVRLWNLETRTSRIIAVSDIGRFQRLAFSPDGRYLAAARNMEAIVYDLVDDRNRYVLTGHRLMISGVAFSPDSDRIATSATDGTTRLWDMATGQEVLLLRLSNESSVKDALYSVAFALDGRAIMAGQSDGQIVTWVTDIPQGDPYREERARYAVQAVSSFPQETALAEQQRVAENLKIPVEHRDGAGLALKLVPAGSFVLGAEYLVHLSRPFYFGATEVTVGQFRKFAEATKYVTDAERFGGNFWDKGVKRNGPEFNWRTPGFPQTDEHPAVHISWNDARAYCRWLSRSERMTYRLPTEAEWEWACRAGSTARYFFGDDPARLPEFAWFVENTKGDGATRPVAQLNPNPWGLYDVHGNAEEWVLDLLGPLPTGIQTDPMGPSRHPNTWHMLRSGCAGSQALYCTASYDRSQGGAFGSPKFSLQHFGFRVVREIPIPYMKEVKAVSPPAGSRLAMLGGNGKWRIDGDELVQDATELGASMLLGDLSWTDYDFSVEAMHVEGEEGFKLWFRAQSFQQLRIFGVGSYGNQWHESAYLRSGKWNRNLLAVRGSASLTDWDKARVEVRGNRFRCFLNEKLLFEDEDQDNVYSTGRVGLQTWGTAVRFRNLKVTAPDGTTLWEGLPELEFRPPGGDPGQ